MNLENLKRWHWAVVGLLVGLLIGWGVKSLNDAGGIGDSGSIGVREFEKELTESRGGYPVLRDIVIHHVNGDAVVTLRRLEVDPRERYPRNPRHFLYVRERLDARTPYIPADSQQAVEVRIDPAAELVSARSGREAWTLSVNGERVFNWSSRLKLAGWTASENHWSDPGPAGSVELSIRPANYRLTLTLDTSEAKIDLPQAMKVSLNDHALGPMTRVAGTALPSWRGQVPAGDFVPGPTQVFRFSRSSQAVKIRGIELLDPNYSVAEFLAAMKRQNPRIAFANAWWERPAVLYATWACVGVLVIGGIWPFVLNLLVGAGYGQRLPKEKEYDLSRFKSEPEPRIVEKQASGEPLDAAHLAELEEELRRSLASQGSQGDRPPAEPEPLRELAGTPQVAPAPAADEEQKDFRGEFYPVARKPADGHGDHHPA